jgi:hypothetical protein
MSGTLTDTKKTEHSKLVEFTTSYENKIKANLSYDGDIESKKGREEAV